MTARRNGGDPVSIFDDDWDPSVSGDGSLAWLGGLAILLSAALMLVGLPWLIVAVLT